MSANITANHGKDLVAVNWSREKPWHLLGQQVQEDMTIDQALELTMSNDLVTARPIYTLGENGEPVDIETHVCMWSDIHGPLSCVKPSYNPTQRGDLLRLAYEITGLDPEAAHVDTIGNLGPRAEQFFAYVRVPDIVIDPNGVADTLERGLFLLTSFDYTRKNTIGYSSIRPVCANTVNMALRAGLKQCIEVPHTVNSELRLKQAAQALEYIGAVEAQMKERAEAMLATPGRAAMKEVLDHFWDVDDKTLSDQQLARRESTRALVRGIYDGPGNTNAELLGHNGYAVYQAVVEYFDHERETRNRGKEDLGVVKAKAAVLPGVVVDNKIKASEIILGLAA